ncbi:hypothetical protein H072_11600 [Dactylellina haptotyla CBS 200.50]|uniref:Tc1-like transposase DDE domain-containing protein n=1 Tax=Dactylellina haptotyla (strain CBS 200.50) TaxID=1284197 RepID=S7ZWL4_DACHA|nr:hypothetical protein H072_11600 [Dactylellina haptotyla CBS 200.50]
MAPSRQQLTNQQRERVKTLAVDAQLPVSDIQRATGYTKHQIRHTLRTGSAVAVRSGRPRVITPDQEAELVAFVTMSSTRADLEERGIQTMQWPAFSPDLNPIEHVWGWMKDYIQLHYGFDQNPSHKNLRVYVTEAWEAVPDAYLQELVDSMPQRCEAANGLHTKY